MTADSGLAGAFPVSLAQQRLWFVEQLVPGTAQHNITRCYRVADGSVDAGALRDALAAVAARHESLRTSFGTVAGEPVQIVADTALIPLEVLDTDDVDRALDAAVHEPFDLSRCPLARVSLIHGPDRTLLAFTLHHLVADGWSFGVLVDEVAASYRAALDGTEAPFQPLPLQYVDYAVWQREQADSPEAADQLRAHLDELAGAPHLLELPGDRPRPPVPSFAGAIHRFEVPASIAADLQEMARRQGATLYMAMLSACFLVLHRWSGATDMLVGSPVAGRTHSETEPLIGFFANTLVVRGELSGDPTVTDLLGRVRDRCLAAFSCQDVPFEQLVEKLTPERSLSRNPLVQMMFGWQNTPGRQPVLPGVRLTEQAPATTAAQVDLTVDLTPATDGRLTGEVHYATELFDAATAARFARHLVTAAEELARHPDRRISEISVIGAAEREHLLRLGTGPEPAGPPRPLPGRIRAASLAHPDRVAVVDADGPCTYRQLREQADAVAAALVRRGTGTGELVAVCLPRTRLMIGTLLGVWAAGAAFVPLDPGYPQDRLAFMAADSGSRLLLTTRDLAGELEWAGTQRQAEAVYVEDLDAPVDAPADPPVTGPDDLAYAMYTSGSTGRPKGVLIEHRGLANQIEAFSDALGVTAEDRMLAMTSMSFDPAWLELFLPLVAGGVVVVTGSDVARDPERLHAVLCAEDVTIAQATPTTWRMYCEHATPPPPRLRQVLTGGEELSSHLAGRLLGLGVRLHQVYGPTETTIWATRAEVADAAAVSLGGPIDRTRVFVVDEAGGLAPFGAVGELWIAGAGVARGFTGGEAAAAGRFATAPDGSLAYRTGDLGRWNPDGTLGFLGRRDDQVKIRGHRIELAEIDAVLRDHPGIRDCLTAVHTGPAQEAVLVSVVIPEEGQDVSAEDAAAEAKQWARHRLPDHMVPRRVRTVSALPLTPSGKSDRRAVARLAAPDGTDHGHTAPADELQRQLHDLWCEVLGVPAVSVADNIFDIGATSLTTVRVRQELRGKHGVDVPLTAFFAHPTIAALAARTDPGGGVPPPRRSTVQRRAVPQAAARRRAGRRGGQA